MNEQKIVEIVTDPKQAIKCIFEAMTANRSIARIEGGDMFYFYESEECMKWVMIPSKAYLVTFESVNGLYEKEAVEAFIDSFVVLRDGTFYSVTAPNLREFRSFIMEIKRSNQLGRIPHTIVMRKMVASPNKTLMLMLRYTY